MGLISEDVFSRLRRRRFIIIKTCMIIAFVAVITKLAHLQLLEGDVLAMRAEKQHRQVVSVEGKRGNIYDRAGRELAANVDTLSIYGTPHSIDEPRHVAQKLSGEVNINAKTLSRRLSSEKEFIWVKRRMSRDLAKHIKTMNLEGIGFIPESKRFYPKKELIGHILGFTGIDNHGLEGIERYYEKSLRGQKGSILLERDARRRPVLSSTLLDPVKGNDLILTIDEVIQYIMEKELDSAVEQNEATGGVGIAMNPFSGEILAMAVNPGFNPNIPAKYRPGQWRNRAITDVYEPGSTFKFVTASAAIEEDLISPNEIVHDGSGSMVFGRSVMHDPHPKGEPMAFKDVIAHSSNIGTAKIGIKVGSEQLHKYIKAFGFGKETGIDLPGEVRGIVRDPSRWSGRSLVTISIGQEVAVTPIQLITAMSAVANGGWLVKPHIVAAIREGDGNISTIKTEIVSRVISSGTSEKMLEILKRVVSPDGTGKLAAVDGFSVAGKTGTAQKVDPSTGRYSKNRFISSFVGFVPADSPEVAILVIVDEPKGIAWGGSIAAPVFKRVAEQTLQYMHIEPEDGKQITITAYNN